MFKKYNYKLILSRMTGVLHYGMYRSVFIFRYPGYIADCICFDSLLETSIRWPKTLLTLIINMIKATKFPNI